MFGRRRDCAIWFLRSRHFECYFCFVETAGIELNPVNGALCQLLVRRRRELNCQHAIDFVRAGVTKIKGVIPPFRLVTSAAFALKQPANGEDVLKRGFEMELERELDWLSREIAHEQRIRQGQLIRGYDTLPTHLDRMFCDHLAIEIQIGIGKPQRRHESRFRGMDQHFGFSAADSQLVTVQEPAILIIETEPVAAGEGNTRIGLAKEKQIPILQNQRIGDATLDGRNARHELGALGPRGKNNLLRHEITWAKKRSDATRGPKWL